MESLIDTYEHSGPEYILLTPGIHPARTGDGFQIQATYLDVPAVLLSIGGSRIVAVDFETRGGDYSEADTEIVGMGLAWDTGSCYFHWSHLSPENRQILLDAVGEHTGTIAHNIYFDGGIFKKATGQHANWYMCTYALLAMLSNESPEMRWGLKDAMVNLLGWESSNETELDRWLVLNGYYKGNRRLNSTEEYLNAEFQSGGLKPEKGYMYKAPAQLLGQYCVLDAEATYLLFCEVLEPVLNHFPGLIEFMPKQMHHILVHVDQKILGIEMDVEGLHKRKEDIAREQLEYTEKFLTHPDVVGPVQEVKENLLKPLLEKAPAQFKKDGKPSKNYLNWQERVAAARNGELPDYKFNIQSAFHLRAVLYDSLGYPVKITSEKGEPSTSIKALKGMGELGTILTERQWLLKESGFIEKYLDLTKHRSTIHSSFRLPGTVTGRLSSKDINLQQVPKTKQVMSLFKARPGKIWIDSDFASLEPTVTTEFSCDPNMEKIYGKEASPYQDFYLYIAASIPGIREKVIAAGYNPDNPTKEGVANAKKICKSERSLCKSVALACAYGAGINKIVETLEADGTYLEYEEVAAIHSGYWDLFDMVRDFGRKLHFEWKKNKGYILNGMGRPMAVAEDYSKDLLNRFVQSTGHDILVTYVQILATNLTNAGIEWSPLVLDWHDSTAVEVNEKDANQVVYIFNQSMIDLNTKLGGRIPLKGTPQTGYNLAEIKEAE